MSSALTNRYICPDDLTPLPTTLDAKNSPLALLAQTCSSIGADLLPKNKNIIPPFEKKKKPSPERADSECSPNKNNSSESRSTSSESVDAKISFKPYETNNTKNKSSKAEICCKHNSHSNSVDVIVEKRFSSSHASSSSSLTEQTNQSPKGVETKSASNQELARQTPSKPSSSTNQRSSSLLYSSSGLSESSKTQLTTACNTSTSFVSSASVYSSNHCLSASGADLLRNDLMKSSHYSGPSLFPYLNQAHAAAINSIKASVCRDPYCKGCQLSARALNANLSCANGCNGCFHSLHSLQLQTPFIPPNLAAYTPHSSNADIPSFRPFVCNWTIAGAFCGKSFASCEELLQHLKTHTNAGTAAAFSDTSSYFGRSGLPSSVCVVPALRSVPNHSMANHSVRYNPYKFASNTVPGNIRSDSTPKIPEALLSSSSSALASLYPAYSIYNGRF